MIGPGLWPGLDDGDHDAFTVSSMTGRPWRNIKCLSTASHKDEDASVVVRGQPIRALEIWDHGPSVSSWLIVDDTVEGYCGTVHLPRDLFLIVYDSGTGFVQWLKSKMGAKNCLNDFCSGLF